MPEKLVSGRYHATNPAHPGSDIAQPLRDDRVKLVHQISVSKRIQTPLTRRSFSSLDEPGETVNIPLGLRYSSSEWGGFSDRPLVRRNTELISPPTRIATPVR